MDRQLNKASQVDEATRSRRRLWMLSLILLSAGVIIVVFMLPSADRQEQSGQPLDGQLIIYVRTSDRGIEPIPIDKAGAVPVQADGIMSLEANFSRPACAYFVWFDCEGKILPLYPWNYDAIEVTDINQPPPTRMGAKVIYSPPIGSGWNFGKKGGIETVLLLARTEPLDPKMSLGSLLKLPMPKMQHREELVGLALNRADKSVSTLFSKNRGSEEDSRAADETLKNLMFSLREHFELVRLVRFTHEEESQNEKK